MSPFTEPESPDNAHDLLRAAMDQVFPGETAPAYVPPPITPPENRDESYVRRARSWCSKALAGRAEALAAMPPNSGRNHALYKAAIAGLRNAQAGYIDPDDVVQTLRDAALESGLSFGEIEATIGSAARKATRDGPEEPPIDGAREQGNASDGFEGLEVDTVTGEVKTPAPPVVIDEEAFWTARPELDHVRTFARARRCSPWAVLGVVLGRVVTATPPFVVLPALVGSYASLNLFVALVAPSGGGKGAAESAASDCVDVGEIETATVGSGEGIGHLYAHREKGEVVRDRDAVLFTVPEVDNLTALGNRQGATLMPQLRSAWSGERLGFSYADKNKALPIERHTYRMGLVLGVQPGRAAPLLDDSDGGTPQRFVWLPTTDPEAPDMPPATPAKHVWAFTTAQWAGGIPDPFGSGQDLYELPIPDEVRLQVGMHALDRLRAQNAEALDGHTMLARLKVAAALALFAGRKNVTLEDWALSDTVMKVSQRTRDGIVSYLSSKARQNNVAKGEAEGQRAVLVADRVAEESAKRVGRRVMSLVRRGPEGMARSEVRRLLAHRDRQYFEDALERLFDAGQLLVETGEKGERLKAAE